MPLPQPVIMAAQLLILALIIAFFPMPVSMGNTTASPAYNTTTASLSSTVAAVGASTNITATAIPPESNATTAGPAGNATTGGPVGNATTAGPAGNATVNATTAGPAGNATVNATTDGPAGNAAAITTKVPSVQPTKRHKPTQKKPSATTERSLIIEEWIPDKYSVSVKVMVGGRRYYTNIKMGPWVVGMKVLAESDVYMACAGDRYRQVVWLRFALEECAPSVWATNYTECARIRGSGHCRIRGNMVCPVKVANYRTNSNCGYIIERAQVHDSGMYAAFYMDARGPPAISVVFLTVELLPWCMIFVTIKIALLTVTLYLVAYEIGRHCLEPYLESTVPNNCLLCWLGLGRCPKLPKCLDLSSSTRGFLVTRLTEDTVMVKVEGPKEAVVVDEPKGEPAKEGSQKGEEDRISLDSALGGGDEEPVYADTLPLIRPYLPQGGQ